jgi:hypothetical protein
LEDAHGAKEFLRRFEIPARAKSDLRKELARLGVTWSTVFPDLEHLARELKEMTFVRGDQVDDQQD